MSERCVLARERILKLNDIMHKEDDEHSCLRASAYVLQSAFLQQQDLRQ